MGLAAIKETTEIIERDFGNVKEENDIEELSVKVENFKKYVEQKLQLGEKIVSGIRDFLEETDESFYIKNKEVLKGFIEHLRRALEVIRAESNRFKSSKSSLLSLGVFVDLARRVESVAEEFDNAIDNLDLVVRYHNKEEGNDLQVAYDRLEDLDDPFITSDEMRKLLGL